jgi:hypothetical protein
MRKAGNARTLLCEVANERKAMRLTKASFPAWTIIFQNPGGRNA